MKPGIDEAKNWYVVRTNIKCEDKATANMRLAGYDVYFPRMRVEVKNRRTNTYTVKERPLMMRYVFVGQPKVNPDWFTLRACEGVESVLGINGTPIAVPVNAVQSIFDDEFDMRYDNTREARIHRKEEARTRKETIAMKFRPGYRAKVTDGPFASFWATVEAATTNGQVDALVEIFGRMTSVRFDPQQLEVA